MDLYFRDFLPTSAIRLMLCLRLIIRCAFVFHFSEELDLQTLAALIVGNEDFEARERDDLSFMISDEEFFSLQGFTSYGRFRNINLSVCKGEIVGIAGLRGSGRTEIFRSIIGADPLDSGTMKLCGRELRFSSPAEAAKEGIVYLTEEREAEGLIPIASVRQNLTMSILSRLARIGILNSGREKETATRSIDQLDIKVASQTQEVQQLSGGNKQKVLVGRVMEQRPKVCLLDEPTRGVDIEAKDSILQSETRPLAQYCTETQSVPVWKGDYAIEAECCAFRESSQTERARRLYGRAHLRACVQQTVHGL